MNGVVILLLVAGGLLAVVALVQMLASRLTLPESTLLALAGIGIGGAYVIPPWRWRPRARCGD